MSSARGAPCGVPAQANKPELGITHSFADSGMIDWDASDKPENADEEDPHAGDAEVVRTASEQSEDLIRLFPRGFLCAMPLGFFDKDMEKLYHKKKLEQMQHSLRWLLRFVSVAVILLFGVSLSSPLSREAPSTFVVFIVINYVVPPLLLLLVRLLIGRVPRRWKDGILLLALGLCQTMYLAASPARLAFFLDVPADQVAPIDFGYSDSKVVGYCGNFIVIVFFLMPFRCRSLLPMLIWIPGCYLGLTLPLPDDIAEQTLSNRLTVAAGLLVHCFIALAAKSQVEFADRVGFATQTLQRRELYDEKVRNVRAEFQADLGHLNEGFDELPGHGALRGQGSGSDLAMSSGGCSSAAFNMNVVFNPETQQIEVAPMNEKMARMVEFAKNEHWLIEDHELEILHHCELGRGGFGKVVVGRLYGLPVAVKMTKSLQALSGMNALVNELRIFRRLRHPNIVMFHGACFNISAGEVFIVEEVVPGATLANLIGPPPSPVRTKARCVILLRICKALRFLHLQSPAIMHGDLKPGNILVPQSMQPKLTDFGLARMIKDRDKGITFQGGTRRWSAPESMRASAERDSPEWAAKLGEVTISADIWSLGRVCYFTVTGELPLETFGPDATPRTGDEVPLQEECLKLCESCGQMDPTVRPSISEVHSQIWHWLPRKAGRGERLPSMAEWLLDDTLLPPDAIPPSECEEHDLDCRDSL